jgi:CheY-specific phosphatase CheX
MMMTGANDFFTINNGETNPHEQALAGVVSATFEKMGFMQAFIKKTRDEDINTLCATLLVKEPVAAKVYFSCPQSLSWKIAENLYGLEELSSEVVADMMSELLNTIAGSWLSEVIPNQKFTLSIPQSCDEMYHVDKEMYEYHFNIDNSGVISIGLKRL